MANGSGFVKAVAGANAICLEKAMSKSEDERAKRLAEALRQNLRRRKAQARGDTAPTDEVTKDKPDSEA